MTKMAGPGAAAESRLQAERCGCGQQKGWAREPCTLPSNRTCSTAMCGRGLKLAVVGNLDLAVDDLLLHILELLEQGLGEERLVVLVEGEGDAAFGHAEVEDAGLELVIDDVHHGFVSGNVNTLHHAGQAVVEGLGVVVGVTLEVLVGVDTDEEERLALRAAAVLVLGAAGDFRRDIEI